MFGFNDQSAFSNTFRKITGQAPLEYRKRFLQDFTRHEIKNQDAAGSQGR